MKEKTFRFKQFALSNERSAMKIGTDGVLLGAWAPVVGVRTVLDAGAGTGLISLMIAQRVPEARITAVEIDHDAAAEASANVAASPWSSSVCVIEADIAEVTDGLGLFDLIVSNPPFFTNGELPPVEARRAARHEGALSAQFLINLASKALTPDGRLAMIIPADRRDEIEFAAAMARLNVERLTAVVTAPDKPPKRHLWLLSRRDCAPVYDTIAIKSPEFKALTAEFYLD